MPDVCTHTIGKDTVPSSIDIFVDALLCDGVKHTGHVLVEDAILQCDYCIRGYPSFGRRNCFLSTHYTFCARTQYPRP